MLGLSLLTLASVALAGPCEQASPSTSIATGPVTAGLYDGDLGVPHRVCGRTEAAFVGGGLAVVDTANFYGHIVAGGTLEGAWAATDRTELFVAVEAVRYDTVITAIPAGYLGFGHVSLGGSQRLWSSDAMAVGAHGRLVLPTAVGLYANAFPLAMDLGASGVWAAHRTLRVHGDVAALGSVAASAGPSYPRAGVALTLGAEWQPVGPFALVVDGRAGFGYTAPVDVVAVAAGLRFGLGSRLGVELGGTVPLAGRERSLATAELRITMRLGELSLTAAEIGPPAAEILPPPG